MKVFLIGTGNVATSLGTAFRKAGHVISGVYGRDELKVNKLSKKLHTGAFYTPESIPRGSDVYLIAIKDDAIKKFADSLKLLKEIVVHTSGTTPVTALSPFKNKGVFYPVETIKTHYPSSFKKVPFCLEASNEPTLKILMKLARSISNEIYLLDSDQRARLHLAAVFTNNFTNHMLGIGIDILCKNQLPKQLLEKLAFSTVSNAFNNGPFESQTGPAIRNDKATIQKHIEMLKDSQGRQRIYKLMTDDILNEHKKKK